MIAVLQKLYKLDPSNTNVTSQLVDLLAMSKDPTKAIPILDDLIGQNPGDPALLETKWKLLLKLERFKDAIPFGEAMVKSDPKKADSNYFSRQMYSAAKDSNWAKVAEFAAGGSKVAPKNVEFANLEAQARNNLNQLPEALAAVNRSLAIDPKQQQIALLKGQILLSMKQYDSLLALARQRVAAGDPKKQWGDFVTSPAQKAVETAQASSSVDDWQKALSLSQYADSLGPSANTQFFIGVSAFYIMADLATKAGQEKSCDKAKAAEALSVMVQMNMAQGGSVSPPTAKTL